MGNISGGWSAVMTEEMVIDAPITTVNGNISGSIHWSMPEQGSGCKKLILIFDNYGDTVGDTITFPISFTYLPDFYVSNRQIINTQVMSITNTQITTGPQPKADCIVVIEGF